MLRLLPEPERVMADEGTNAALVEVVVIPRRDEEVSKSETVNGTGLKGFPTATFLLPITEMTGGSFTGLTVRMKLLLAASDPSLAVMVMVAVPL